ncbi:response regulator transcription factor [Nocardioides kribbensis]|uniref:response regulator transcription factor n=1 Tax=Nocardioides kribbensis TaxID=305517 RepID=UPI0029D41811|nr:response regulator transcription factor [Nocardioides kribbensis]
MSKGQRVVVVEDDPDISATLVMVLERTGLEVHATDRGERAVELVRELSPDLVTLDLTLPDMDGTEVCRRLREFSDAFIMMITGRSDEIDRLIGLEVGADDYMAKPFSAQEVRARVAALLRRARSAVEAPPLSMDAGGGLTLLPSAHTATLDGAPLPLTPAEVDLMAAFASRPGETWTRGELVRTVWQGEFIESDFLVDVHVGNLRRKLRRAGSKRSWIRTVDGSGYVYDPS